MDLKQLTAEHADTFAAALEQGVQQERDRVCAHLIMGESSGDMKTACLAIKDGLQMTSALQATYMTAGMNRRDVENRQHDDISATAGDNATKADEGHEELTQAETVALLVEEKLGLRV